ncbi:MAG: 3-phosphoshikimate 1-carboxyvinyltransferase [Lachnospiraceae bacterium]|nr:3-phosphoshikimate 1-carboxyvinyltransferase [Lachnospiraceae bacterium]
MTTYEVPMMKRKMKDIIKVPGSKSLSNRVLLLAAKSEGTSVVSGVQFSDDTRHFLQSLRDLGYELEIDEKNYQVTVRGCGRDIPKKKATIDVGSAGTGARFLTSFLAFSDGEYEIQCSEQMKKRPMKELFHTLEDLGVSFRYLEEKGHLPIKLRGLFSFSDEESSEENELQAEEIAQKTYQLELDISRSTQYLTAWLLTFAGSGVAGKIRVTSEKKTGTYIQMTMDLLKDFGVPVTFDGDTYVVDGREPIKAQDYQIEVDMSGACYFYAAAAILGGEVEVEGVHRNLHQGDLQFLHVLELMGCTVEEGEKGLRLKSPVETNHYVIHDAEGKERQYRFPVLHGVCINMNQFSDQALTLAAIAPFADSVTEITGIAHIRGQECDRIHAMVENLTALGIKVEELEDGVRIYPLKEAAYCDRLSITFARQGLNKHLIHTYEDHRVAMSFALTGLRIPGIVIENPECCRKTFENYFEIWDDILTEK